MRWFLGPILFLLLMPWVDLEEVVKYPIYSTTETASVTLEIFRRQNLWQSTVFVCDKSDGLQLLRLLGKDVQTLVILGKTDPESKLKSARARLGVVVFPGNRCVREFCSSILSNRKTFSSHQNSTYRWVLIGKTLEDVRSDFEQYKIKWDTSVTAIVPNKSLPQSQTLFDLYQKNEKILSSHQIGLWQNKSMKNWLDAENALHRKNMHQYRIYLGLTVTRHKTWDNSKIMDILDLPPGDPRLPDEDCQLMPFHVLRITSEMFNYTLAGVNGYKGPGYPHPNGTYTDLLGAIQKDEIHCSATNLLIFGHRRKIVKYLGFCYYFRNALVYLSTNTFSTPTALIQPFSYGIWILLGIYVIVCSVLIMTVSFYDGQNRGQRREISVSKSSLVILGSLSGQGEPTKMTSTSFYVLFLMMLVFGVVVNCAYSAVIVRFLLAEPSPNYPTRNHLMKSSLKVAAHDFFYYRNTVFGPNMTKVYREIYEQKMTPPGGFKDVFSAFDGLLMGKWALLLAEPVFYQLTAQTATPQQKCRLFDVPDMPTLANPLCPMIQKDFPAVNMLNRGLTLLRERGFYSRAARIWFAPKPSCTEGGARQWSSVALKVLYPAIGLIGAGLCISILLLMLEFLYKRYESTFRTKNKDATVSQVF